MRTRYKDGGLYYMGGKYGMGGMYPSFNEAGQFNGNGDGDPKKIKSANTNNIDFNSGDDTVKSTRTYTEGPTTTTKTPWRTIRTEDGGESQPIENFLGVLNEFGSNPDAEYRLVDQDGNEITEQKQLNQYRDYAFEQSDAKWDEFTAAQAAYKRGEVSRDEVNAIRKEWETLRSSANALPDRVQKQGKYQNTRNLYGAVAAHETPELYVQRQIEREAHWFDPNNPIFGEGGFDVSNPAHVIEYQMMYNHLASDEDQIKVDGKWGEQTQSAHIDVDSGYKEKRKFTQSPELQMRLTEERPSGGWDQEQEGGSGGDYRGGYGSQRRRRRKGGGGGGGGGCIPGRPCDAYSRAGGGRYNLGGIMKTKFKDGGVYVMR